MKFSRLRSRNQILHTDSSTPSHHRDKAVGEKRRRVQFIAVGAADRPSPERSFPGVVGVEVIHDPETLCWTVCSNPGDLAAHLVREAAARTRYYAPVRRRGRVEMMSRIDPTPLTDHTVSFHPAHSDLIAELTARGEGQDLPRELMSHFIKAAVPLFAGQRYVLGAALHVDTADPHIGFQVSRNGPIGRLGDAGMNLVGPWMVAVDRQIRCGAEINKEKRRQYDRAMASFRRRYGAGAVPFDIILARTFDTIAEKVLGGQLTPYVERYAAGVPALEREQLEASLAQIDAKRAVLIQALTECSPELLRASGALPAPAAEVADARGGNAEQAEAIASPALGYKAEHMPVI